MSENGRHSSNMTCPITINLCLKKKKKKVGQMTDDTNFVKK